MVAAAMSPTMEKILLETDAEGRQKWRSDDPEEDGVIELCEDALGGGVDPASLPALAEYIYTGELEVTRDTLWNVLRTADYLQIDGAKALCAGRIADGLSPGTVLGALDARVEAVEKAPAFRHPRVLPRNVPLGLPLG